MAVELKIPSSGESISEVQIGEWRKAEGERVERDEIVVEIETDKASMELPSPVSGVLERIVHLAGTTVAVGEVIGYIAEGGNGRPEQGEATKKGKPQPESKDAAEEDEDVTPAPRRAEKPPAPSARRKKAERETVEEEEEEDDRAEREPKKAQRAEREGKEEPAAEKERPRTPAARTARAGEREEERVPMTMLRRRIAERLVAAQQTAALLTTFNEIDMTAVLEMRRRFGEDFLQQHGIKLGIMSFFVKAAIEALKRVPAVNAEVHGTDIIYHNYFDIGVAVATDAGLVVPVLRDADGLSFAETEQAIADFARRARERKLSVEELTGGTFTITNGGVFGSLLSTPIVNPPQSGILGLHTIQDRPVAREGQVVIRPMMYVALTYDHRLVDGREAVTFLRHVKEIIEVPSRILIEI